MELNKLRPKLLEKLKGKQFIEDVSLENSITIIEPNNKEDDKLKEVKINNFDLFVSGKKAWRINLESSTVDGLQSSNKTTETALIFVKDNGIDVYLIEMKSMIVLDKIKDIKRKLQDTISRCYFLFILNSDESHNSIIENRKNFKICFKACIFYNGTHKQNKNPLSSDSEDIIKVFKGESRIITTTPILGNQVIPVRFISQPFQNGIIQINASQLFNF